MNHPFFSIILPTYNRLHSLENIILPSIEKQNFLDYELIVVDDSSSDGTKKYFGRSIIDQKFPRCSQRLKYERNVLNAGSPASRNTGFQKATGEWVFMVEDDLEIRDDNFLVKAHEIILKLVKEDAKIAVVCPKREELFMRGYYTNYNGKFINYGYLSKEIYCDPNQEYEGYIENAQACSFIRADIARHFQYDYKTYNYFREETDFYERIKRAGHHLYYVGHVLKTYHRMDLASKGGNRKHSISITNECKYIRSHYSFLKKYFNYSELRLVAFILLRLLKHISNLFKITMLKNLLSLIKL